MIRRSRMTESATACSSRGSGGIDPAASDGFTKSGLLFTIVHLNRATKNRDGARTSTSRSGVHVNHRAAQWPRAARPAGRQPGT